MRALRRACRRPCLFVLILCPFVSFACEQLPSGQTLWIRLTSPISTYNAKVGDLVYGVVTEDVVCDDATVVPLGASVLGTVRSVRKVGLGFRHETAALKIQFNEIAIAPGGTLTVVGDVAAIDNAREQVSNGIVHGIRSSNTPQGTVTSRLKYLPAFNPYPDLGLLLFKATFPIFPEPEIYLPVGTDIQVKLEAPVLDPPSMAVVDDAEPIDALAPAELRALIASVPERSTTPKMAMADIVNLALLGSKQQVESAFSLAGWQTADPINRHSIALNFYAVLKNSSYTHAPMRPFLLDGRVPDMNWQKSFDTYAQRDHMRMWEWNVPGIAEPVWLGTATHDKSAGFSLKHHQFVHHIDPAIDDERSKIIRDLRAAGCVRAVYLVPRRDVAEVRENATGDVVKTGGAIAVVQLQECHAAVPELASDPEAAPYKPGSAVFRYFRREVLTVRSDIWRANIIYAGYDVVRMTVRAWRHHPAVAATGPTSKPNSTDVAQSFKSSAGIVQ